MLAYLTNQKKINDMKKILTFGAALAIVAGTFTITSCYDHHIEQWSNAQFAQAKYEKAFIARFGQPAKDQTWGFGTVATKSFGLSTRAIASSYPFPKYSRIYNYLDDLPEGVIYY